MMQSHAWKSTCEGGGEAAASSDHPRSARPATPHGQARRFPTAEGGLYLEP